MSADQKETEKMARFGATVYAILAFTPDWDSDTTQAIADLAAGNGLNVTDRAQARRTCRTFGISPEAVGDNAPTLVFTDPACRPAATQEIEEAFAAWHDTQAGDSNDDEHEAAADLIDALLSYAHISIK